MTHHTRLKVLVSSLPCRHECSDFQKPVHTIMPVHSTIQLTCRLISPKNRAQKLCILTQFPLNPFTWLKSEVWIVFRHCMQWPWHLGFPLGCSENPVYTWLGLPDLRSASPDCVNCYNTIAEVSSVVWCARSSKSFVAYTCSQYCESQIYLEFL